MSYAMSTGVGVRAVPALPYKYDSSKQEPDPFFVNVDGGIVIPVISPSAYRTGDRPHRKLFCFRVLISALAELRTWEKLIDPDKMVAFSALFIFQHGTKHAVAIVQGRLSKPQALCHPAHIEILHRNQVILVGYLR